MVANKREKTQYQRPGSGGPLVTEPGYVMPSVPSVPDELETVGPQGKPGSKVESDLKQPPVPDVLEEPKHVGVGEAVPVRVVNFTRELDRISRHTMYRHVLAAGQRMVVPARRNRLSLRLRCVTDAGEVSISHDGIGDGFPLVTGQPDVEITSQASVWIQNNEVTDMTVGIVEEYVTELR